MCMFLIDFAKPIVSGNPSTKNDDIGNCCPNTCITILSNGSPITISNAPANIIAMTIPTSPVIAK